MNAGWKQRPEGGGRFALWLIRGIGRYGGRALGRLCLYPITAYFLLRRGPERRASLAFLSRALGRPATLRDAARHLHCFAATILDRLFLLRGDMHRFDIAVHGISALEAQLGLGRGLLLFGSHLGSFEVLRAIARRRPDLEVRVVLDRGQNPALTRMLDALDPKVAAGVIDAAQEGTALMLAIQQAAARGALIALLVDRVQPGKPSVEAPFLGAPMALPLAPWQIAAVLRLPVALAFGLYRGGRRYDLYFESFSDGIDLPRQRRAQELPALIRRYAARLEHHARSAPYNWFNFYDVWTPGDEDAHSDPIDPGRLAAAGGHRDGVSGGGGGA